MLVLKLLLVPVFLLLISLAGKRWGPSVAGWLAGLPVVAGPILLFLACERGRLFASNAASASLSAVLASVCFSLAYAHAAQQMTWPRSLSLGLIAWLAAAFGLALLPVSLPLAACIAILALLFAPRWFPAGKLRPYPRLVSPAELCCRMLAGVALTVAVTFAAGKLGQAWSGLLAVFPVLGTVLAVFAHRAHGPAYAATLLRAMVTGLYAFAIFCLSLSIVLPRMNTTTAFFISVAAALAVQAATRKRVIAPKIR